MAPGKNPGGRPRLAWTPSRQRKLVRLYLMTDLKIDQIRKVMTTDGFAPGRRNIQTQLSLLLPDNANEWRQYRPSNLAEGKQRLSQLKHARELQKSRHAKRRARAQECTKRQKVESSTPDTDRFLYDPMRHYEEVVPAGIPNHISMPLLDQWYSQRSSSQDIALGTETRATIDDRSSDKEVIPETLDDCSSDNMLLKIFAAQAPNAEVTTENHGPFPVESILSPGGFLARSTKILEARATGKETTGQEDAKKAARVKPRLKRLFSEVSIALGTKSLRVRQSMIPSISSSARSHVNSVLSATDTSRSSDILTTSVDSGRLSATSSVGLTREEFATWNELVDESFLPPTSKAPLDLEAISSLYTRKCCSFFQKDLKRRTICTTCGFEEMHQLARYSKSNGIENLLIDCALRDRFGNTPLHHAAAAMNTKRVNQLMSIAYEQESSLLSARNTWGETFLHVMRIEGPQAFPEYVKIIKTASDLNFPFEAPDSEGRSVGHRLHELMDEWNVDPLQLREVGEYLGIEVAYTYEDGSSRLPCELDSAQRPKELPSGSSHRPDRGDQVNEKANLSNPLMELRKIGLSMPPPPPVVPKTPADNYSDLVKVLNNWSTTPETPGQLRWLIKKTYVNSQDEEGNTVLAIAARLGLREAVFLLLELGAYPNARNYRSISVMQHVARGLGQARKENRVSDYSRILSCMMLLSDYGGRVIVTDADEPYKTPPNLSEKARRAASFLSQFQSWHHDAFFGPREIQREPIEIDGGEPTFTSTWLPEPDASSEPLPAELEDTAADALTDDHQSCAKALGPLGRTPAPKSSLVNLQYGESNSPLAISGPVSSWDDWQGTSLEVIPLAELTTQRFPSEVVENIQCILPRSPTVDTDLEETSLCSSVSEISLQSREHSIDSGLPGSSQMATDPFCAKASPAPISQGHTTTPDQPSLDFAGGRSRPLCIHESADGEDFRLFLSMNRLARTTSLETPDSNHNILRDISLYINDNSSFPIL